jgi:hypothetical protein
MTWFHFALQELHDKEGEGLQGGDLCDFQAETRTKHSSTNDQITKLSEGSQQT